MEERRNREIGTTTEVARHRASEVESNRIDPGAPALYGAGSWAMTASREKSLRTAQRKMLRSILGKGRQRTEPSGSEVSYEVGDVTLDDDECLETWVEWKQRTIREALKAMEKVGVPDWSDEQRRRLWRWAGHVARRMDYAVHSNKKMSRTRKKL